jgi:hypothetical protein
MSKANGKAKITTGELRTMLRTRHGQESGNGPAHVLVEEVRDAAGFDSRRTIDAVSMSLWPSRGLLLTGFELKCSRSDWQRELKKPEKAEQFMPLVDYFYLVVSDDTIVRENELPPLWGLLVARGGKLVQQVEAPALRDLTPPTKQGRYGPMASGERELPPRFGRSFLASLLRQANRQREHTPAEVQQKVEQEVEFRERDQQRQLDSKERQLEEARGVIRDFNEASGLNLSAMKYGPWTAADVGKAVRVVLDGEHNIQNAEARLRQLRASATRLVEQVDAQLEAAT